MAVPKQVRGVDRYRQIVGKVLEGYKYDKIADLLHCSKSTIAKATRDPRFKLILEKAMNKAAERVAGKIEKRAEEVYDAVVDRLKTEAIPSIDRIVELRDYAERESVRLDAAKALLDYMGKQGVAAATNQTVAPDAETFRAGQAVADEFTERNKEQPVAPVIDEKGRVN